MSEQHGAGRPEQDDSVNPTTAAPKDQWGRLPRTDADWEPGAGRSGGWDSETRDDDRGSDAGQGGPGRRSWSTSGAGAGASQFLSQLQAMIDNLATQAAPVVREIGAKAAELAAIAAERAGPLAQTAAEKTQEVGARVAERSRGLAEEWRGQEGRHGSGASEAADGPADTTEDTTAPQGPTV